MKTNKKFIVLVLALIMMCLCLTGCGKLDELREEHATFTTKDDFSSITLNGTEYKRIDVEHPPYPTNCEENERNPIAVTQPDVPLLLSKRLGNTLYCSGDGNFIYGWLYKYEEFDSIRVLYCKADMYDDVSSKVEQGLEYNKYAMVYYDDKHYVLTQEEIDTVNKIIKEVEPVENYGGLKYYSSSYRGEPIIDYCELGNFEFVYRIEKVTDNNLFGTRGYQVLSNGNNYVLLDDSFTADHHTGTSHIPVPEDMKDVFVKLEKIAYDNEGSFNQFME